MKNRNTKILRSIDTLGRLVLPKEMRDYLNFKAGGLVEIIPAVDGILIKKFDQKTAFSEQVSHLMEELDDNVDISDDKIVEIESHLKAIMETLGENN